MIDYICKMKELHIERLVNWYGGNYENKLKGRWIKRRDIEPILQDLSFMFKVENIGFSFKNREINSVKIGTGKIKILFWTQMHGNESTGTKALFDLFKFFDFPGEMSAVRDHILERCTILCIPMLNPDGSEVYTRLDGTGVDLNRDFIDKKSIESRLLQKTVDEFQPDYCFNMHDQRSIFSVGSDVNTATLSFLAPSEDVNRKITKGRIKTMEVIVSMNEILQNVIPNHIGRYTDEFYPSATGDNFQKLGFNTILIESGHHKGDYQREMSRKFTFFALLKGILFISEPKSVDDYSDYFKIPDNEKLFLDMILKDVLYEGRRTDIGILYEEKLINEEIQFVPKVDKIEVLSKYNADKVIVASELIFDNKMALNAYIKKGSF